MIKRKNLKSAKTRYDQICKNMTVLGFEPRFSRPQREVLTTRRYRHMQLSNCRYCSFTALVKASAPKYLTLLISNIVKTIQ